MIEARAADETHCESIILLVLIPWLLLAFLILVTMLGDML